MILFTDIIARKRDGEPLTAAEIAVFVEGLSDNSLPAEQVAALAMAICLRSMNRVETAELTRRMAHSGQVLSWRNLDGPVVDKHSTGGVGDKVSLMLAPIVAACGCYVPMISGRGLGHTGGTLDKLSAIPGYTTQPGPSGFERAVRKAGCAIIGQSDDLAPADRRLYAIRDVTATIESVPLITASILSKKIAAGLDGLVLDVKVGSGAFMHSMSDARDLAQTIVATAGESGLDTVALITDMNEALGSTVGNALETMEAIDFLTGARRDQRLNTLTTELAAEMLLAVGQTGDRPAADEQVRDALSSGRAAERFELMVAVLGGPGDILTHGRKYLPEASVTLSVFAEDVGQVAAIDAAAIGHAVIGLGGGRRHLDDELDLSVGFSELAGLGATVDAERPLALVHAANRATAAAAADALRAAFTLGDPPKARPVVIERVRP